MKPAAQTPIAFIKAMVLAYKRRGIDPHRALHAAQIVPSQLDNRDGRVTASQLESFTGTAVRELEDEGLGWFSRPLPWGTHGLLCRAALPSANLRVALIRWCRHHGLLVPDISLRLERKGQIAQLILQENRELGDYREFCVVTTFRNIHGFACWLCDSRIPLTEARFPYTAPAHARAYDFMFRAPVVFEAQQATICFDAAYLGLAVRRNDDDLRQMLLRPLPLVVLQYRRDRLLSQRIRQLLGTQGAMSWQAPILARQLLVSTRTLHRQLAEEGTTLQQIKNEVRRELTMHQLTHTDRRLKQIAASAGFQNEASFCRAFKQWTGQSPRDFRRSRV